MAVDLTLLERFPDPVLVVRSTGETVYGNRPWHELAARLGVEPQLAAVFGPPVHALLADASRGGRASLFLPLAGGGDVTQGFRLTIRADAGDGTLVVQLTDLSEEVAWRHQLFLRNSELSVLNDIGAALSGTIEFDALAQRIWEQTGRILDNANFFMALLSRDSGRLRFPIWVEGGRAAAPDEPDPFARSLAGHVLLGRQPLLLNGDVAAQLGRLGIAPPAGPCVSLVAVPILSEGSAVGVLGLMEPAERDRFGRHQLGILSIVATQAASAIRTAWMFEAMRLAYDELASTQTRLLESERLRGVTETVGTRNHEVNNPLATIMGTAQLLLRRGDFEADTRERIERIVEAAKRIQFVTSKMATLIQATSRPYPGQLQILDVARSVSSEEPAPAAEGSLESAMRFIREALPGQPGPERGAGDANAA